MRNVTRLEKNAPSNRIGSVEFEGKKFAAQFTIRIYIAKSFKWLVNSTISSSESLEQIIARFVKNNELYLQWGKLLCKHV